MDFKQLMWGFGDEQFGINTVYSKETAWEYNWIGGF